MCAAVNIPKSKLNTPGFQESVRDIVSSLVTNEIGTIPIGNGTVRVLLKTEPCSGYCAIQDINSIFAIRDQQLFQKWLQNANTKAMLASAGIDPKSAIKVVKTVKYVHPILVVPYLTACCPSYALELSKIMFYYLSIEGTNEEFRIDQLVNHFVDDDLPQIKEFAASGRNTSGFVNRTAPAAEANEAKYVILSAGDVRSEHAELIQIPSHTITVVKESQCEAYISRIRKDFDKYVQIKVDDNCKIGDVKSAIQSVFQMTTQEKTKAVAYITPELAHMIEADQSARDRLCAGITAAIAASAQNRKAKTRKAPASVKSAAGLSPAPFSRESTIESAKSRPRKAVKPAIPEIERVIPDVSQYNEDQIDTDQVDFDQVDFDL